MPSSCQHFEHGQAIVLVRRFSQCLIADNHRERSQQLADACRAYLAAAGLPEEAPLMACHVLAHVSEIGREIASVATQVHGGIGWTDEQNLHFWFKRIGVARHLLGGPELLRGRAAEIQGLAEAC